MSKFHSTMNRRSFMKMMAATVGGVGAAAAAAPVFHDVDELLSSTAGHQKRPWYVKERDLYNPTLEIDWTVLKRPDCRLNGQAEHWDAFYYGADRTEAANQVGYNAIKGLKDTTGYSYKNRAMKAMNSSYAFAEWPSYVKKNWDGFSIDANWKGADYALVQTPAQRSEPKWTGTPEEASGMLAAWMRVSGAGLVGFGQLDGKAKAQVISANHKGATAGFTRPATSLADDCPVGTSTTPILLFEDVDQGYIGTYNGNTGGKWVIPNKTMSFISVFEVGNTDRGRAGPAAKQQGASNKTATLINCGTYNFLRYLGYQMLGDGGDNGTPFVEGAAAILSGVGEMSRQGNYTLTPEYGNQGRLHNFLTDLPLAPSNPIDAGMWRFCHACHKCADGCPPGVISQDKEPSYDMPQIEGKPYYNGHAGIKEFWPNNSGCELYWKEIGTSPNLAYGGASVLPELQTGCFRCFGNCTFTQDTGAMIHEVIKPTIANISVFNGFFYKMAEDFGYGVDLTNQKSEDWWDKSYPILGMDSARVAFDGGYRKG